MLPMILVAAAQRHFTPAFIRSFFSLTVSPPPEWLHTMISSQDTPIGQCTRHTQIRYIYTQQQKRLTFEADSTEDRESQITALSASRDLRSTTVSPPGDAAPHHHSHSHNDPHASQLHDRIPVHMSNLFGQHDMPSVFTRLSHPFTLALSCHVSTAVDLYLTE